MAVTATKATVPTTEVCSVCGSGACLVLSPDFCRTMNQERSVSEVETETTTTKPSPKKMPQRKGGRS